MANWVADFLTRNPDKAALPVALRAKHSIHFQRPDGQVEAHFTGSPCHYLDTDGLWKPVDTALKPAAGGFFGAPGLDVQIHPDGRVKVGDYRQLVELPGSPVGKVDGDRVVREFAGGKQYLYLMEHGYREEIILDRPLSGKFGVRRQGKLPNRFIQHPLTAIDASGNRFVFAGDLAVFDKWLADVIYPVMIDPDFVEDAADGYVQGHNATYNTARSTSYTFNITDIDLDVGQKPGCNIYRSFLKFDTSTIPDTDFITQNNLTLTVVDNNFSITDFDVQIIKQDWSAQEPIAAGTREAAYDNCLNGSADDNIWQNTANVQSYGRYASGNLSTTWVNKTGNTYYSLRSSRDYAGNAPSYDEWVYFYSQNFTQDPTQRPILTVMYSPAISIPVLMNQYRQRRA